MITDRDLIGIAEFLAKEYGDPMEVLRIYDFDLSTLHNFVMREADGVIHNCPDELTTPLSTHVGAGLILGLIYGVVVGVALTDIESEQ